MKKKTRLSCLAATEHGEVNQRRNRIRQVTKIKEEVPNAMDSNQKVNFVITLPPHFFCEWVACPVFKFHEQKTRHLYWFYHFCTHRLFRFLLFSRIIAWMSELKWWLILIKLKLGCPT
jgi:hypothetical protein